jgi:CBS-domain-containing membrane protein
MKPPISSDVTCRSVMSAGFASLTASMTITECVKTLLENRVLAMPVVDEAGRYIGHFRKNLLISAILPRVAVMDERIERIARMLDAGLLRDNWGEVLSRFESIAGEPVSLHLDKEAPVLRPDDSLVAAMYYLFRGRNFLPVVEPGSGLLVGVVSAWDVLEHLIAKP